MGIFVNPGNASFTEALNSKIYVDKSGLISVINQRIKTQQKYICVSRPRIVIVMSFLITLPYPAIKPMRSILTGTM